MKARVYIDTSVIGGCLDEEFAQWSKKLFEEFVAGEKVAVVSELTRKELEGAPERVRKVLAELPEDSIEHVWLTEEAEALAGRYLEEGVVTKAHIIDAQHIAIASVERVDVLSSWNFEQIVNLERIRAFNGVNLKAGYPVLEVRSPREIIHEEGI